MKTRGAAKMPRNRHGLSPNPVGWDEASLAEFDRRWLRGDTIKELSQAFNIGFVWICRLRRRRGLPTRRDPDGKYRGGNKGVRANAKA